MEALVYDCGLAVLKCAFAKQSGIECAEIDVRSLNGVTIVRCIRGGFAMVD